MLIKFRTECFWVFFTYITGLIEVRKLFYRNKAHNWRYSALFYKIDSNHKIVVLKLNILKLNLIQNLT